MSRLTSEELQRLITDADREARSYSGRGMYGTQCIGLDIERGQSVFTVLAELTQAAIDADVADEWLDVMAATKSDSMGLGSIIYWPRMEWIDGERESDAPTVGADEMPEGWAAFLEDDKTYTLCGPDGERVLGFASKAEAARHAQEAE